MSRGLALLALLVFAAGCGREPALHPDLSPELARIIRAQRVPGVSSDVVESVALEIMRSGASPQDQTILLKSQLAVLGQAAAVIEGLDGEHSNDLLVAVSAAIAAGISELQLKETLGSVEGSQAIVRLDRVTALVTSGIPFAAASIVADQEYP